MVSVLLVCLLSLQSNEDKCSKTAQKSKYVDGSPHVAIVYREGPPIVILLNVSSHLFSKFLLSL